MVAGCTIETLPILFVFASHPASQFSFQAPSRQSLSFEDFEAQCFHSLTVINLLSLICHHQKNIPCDWFQKMLWLSFFSFFRLFSLWPFCLLNRCFTIRKNPNHVLDTGGESWKLLWRFWRGPISNELLDFWNIRIVTKASSGRAKLEFLFTKIGVGWKLIWPRDRIDISKERALHPPPPSPPEKIDKINMTPPPPGIDFNWKGIDLGGSPPPLELIRGDMLGMVLECHEGTIGCDRLLLKDCHVLVVCNFIETGNSHEHKCNRHFRKLLARLRDIHSKGSWHSCTTDITSYTEVLTSDTLAGSQFQFIFATELLGMVFACHEGTIGYDRLLLKDSHVLVVHNFTETGNSHEHKCNRHFRKLLARLRDTHWGTLLLSLGLLLSCKSPDSDQRHQRNKTTWNSMESNQSWINKQTFST